MAEPDPRIERQATFAGLAALFGAAGGLCASAFLGLWFTDARHAGAAAMTWADMAPAGVVVSEALAAVATAVLCTLAVIHLRVGRVRRAYAIAVIVAGVRGASVALMADGDYRASWAIAGRDVWVKLMIGFAVAQIVMLLVLFALFAPAALGRTMRRS